MRQMIAYGLESARDRDGEEKAAMQWARAHDMEVLLWCREAAMTSRDRVERRPQLHHVLFCLRAGDAQVLWFPDWSVLGDQVTQDLVSAEALSTGALIVVDGKVVAQEVKTELQELALAWVRLSDVIDPRQTEPDDRLALVPDIGEFEGDWHRARLARKLRDDFNLSPSETAAYMNKARYRTDAGETWSGASVRALIRRHPDEPGLSAERILAEKVGAGLTSLALATFGPGAEQLVPTATSYNESLSHPFKLVFPIPCNDVLPGPKPLGLSDLKDSGQIRQLLLGIDCPFIGCVYASKEEAFGESTAARELVYANCWRHGVVVVIAGEPLDPLAVVDEQSMLLRGAARSAVRLRLILRAHDADSVRY